MYIAAVWLPVLCRSSLSWRGGVTERDGVVLALFGRGGMVVAPIFVFVGVVPLVRGSVWAATVLFSCSVFFVSAQGACVLKLCCTSGVKCIGTKLHCCWCCQCKRSLERSKTVVLSVEDAVSWSLHVLHRNGRSARQSM